MIKEIFISFVLIAFFNYIIGCSVTKTEKVTNNFSKEIISDVVLTNFSQIKFDDNGGKYESAPAKIVGYSNKGEKFEVDLDNIKEIRVSNPPSIKNEELNNKRITEIIANDYTLYEFGPKGATYIKDKSEIVGFDKYGRQFEITLNNILQIHTEEPQLIPTSKISLYPDTLITQVVNNDNRIYIFDQTGGKYVKEHDIVKGVTTSGNPVEINPDSILYANVKRTDVAGTILASIGLVLLFALGVGLIIAATKESCPFVYSYDGKKYIFDAEPLGGATSKVLERTEYSRMEHLKEIDNKYKILVRNEVKETQYIDEMSLLCIKHDADKQVYPDLDGNFYQIKDPIKPVAAFDEKGTDLKEVVSYDDQLYWQTKMPVDSNLLRKNYRQTLTFIFTKPDTAKSVKLIVNIGTTLWGSRMIKEMLQLYGKYIDTWYSKLNRKEIEYYQMMNFIEKEELYKLKIYIKNNNEWIEKGFINGGGPLISETRVYNIDISDIKGDSLVIKCNPPYGFWTVNYTAVEYNYYSTPSVEKIPLIEATANQKTDIKNKIISRDSIYQLMPNVGDQFYAVYKAAEEKDESLSSYFLRTTGYYEIHIDKEQPVQLNKLSSLTIPGEIVKWSNEDYLEWQNEHR